MDTGRSFSFAIDPDDWDVAPVAPNSAPRPDFVLPDDALAESEDRYLYTIALSPMIAWTADPIGGLVEVDDRGLDLFGLTRKDARGSGFLSAVHPSDRQRISRMWRQNASLGHPIDHEVRMRMRNGDYRWHRSRAAPRRDRNGCILCWYGTIEDIHDRKTADDALRWTAEHDGLTGLFNRRAFGVGLKQALLWSDAHQSRVALLLLDLDNFKSVNDQFGHDVGDALLKDVAARLKRFARKPMMAGRLGGDEFALFLAAPDQTQLDALVDEAIAALDQPLRDADETYDCRVSVGVSVYPAHGVDTETLGKNADLALYEAKAKGIGVCYFRNDMRARMQARLSMLSVARDILAADAILPFYQPKVDLSSGRVIGFEALLRWHRPGRDLQYPASISAAFDDVDLSTAIGKRMRQKIIADMQNWRAAALDFGRVAFNVSSAEFRQPDFVPRLLGELQNAAIPPETIELELTEHVFLNQDTDRVARQLRELNAAGVSIALDDFGTGYASLVHLTMFPIDTLKIDKSFVEQLSASCSAAIVRAIIDLGRGLNITTVAEGVETQRQARSLRSKGCDLAQGFLFSAAVPADQVPELLRGSWPAIPANDRRRGDRRAKSA